MEKVVAFIVAFVGLMVVALGIGLLLTYPLMWGINYTFTPAVLMALFGVAQLTFWKTYVLSFVLSFMFKDSYTSSSK